MSTIVRTGPAARLGAVLLFIGPLVSWAAEFITAAAWQHSHYWPFYNWVSHLGFDRPEPVLGPVLGPDYSPSLGLVQRMLDGEQPALPKFAMGYVDVRDVADLHLRAMTDPPAAGERVPRDLRAQPVGA